MKKKQPETIRSIQKECSSASTSLDRSPIQETEKIISINNDSALPRSTLCSTHSSIKRLQDLNQELSKEPGSLIATNPLNPGLFFFQRSLIEKIHTALLALYPSTDMPTNTIYGEFTLSPAISTLFAKANESQLPSLREFAQGESLETKSQQLRILKKHTQELVTALGEKELALSNSAFRRNALKNYRAIKAFFDQIAKRRSNLLALRLDTHYGNYPAEKRMDIDRLTKDRLKLIAYARKRFNTALLGYVWRMEVGHTRGPHFHFLIFLCGAKHQQDINLCRELGEFWKNVVTNGEGTYFNCNAAKPIYKNQAIGKICTTENEVSAGLSALAAYFSLGDLHVQFKWPDRVRTIGKGGLPHHRKPGPGRKPIHTTGLIERHTPTRVATRAINFV